MVLAAWADRNVLPVGQLVVTVAESTGDLMDLGLLQVGRILVQPVQLLLVKSIPIKGSLEEISSIHLLLGLWLVLGYQSTKDIARRPGISVSLLHSCRYEGSINYSNPSHPE